MPAVSPDEPGAKRPRSPARPKPRRGVDQRQSSWVVPRDTWYLLREKIWSPASGSVLPFKLAFTNALLRSDSIKGAFKALQRAGYLRRLNLAHAQVQ